MSETKVVDAAISMRLDVVLGVAYSGSKITATIGETSPRGSIALVLGGNDTPRMSVQMTPEAAQALRRALELIEERLVLGTYEALK